MLPFSEPIGNFPLDLLSLSERHGIASGRLLADLVGNQQVKDIFYHPDGSAKKFTDLKKEYADHQREQSKDIMILVKGLAGKFDSAAEVRSSIDRLIKRNPHDMHIRPNGPKSQAWTAELQKLIDTKSVELSKDFARSSISPIDGSPLIRLNIQQNLRNVGFSVHHIKRNDLEPGITVLTPIVSGKPYPADSLLENITQSLDRTQRLLDIKRTRPLKYLVLPSKYLSSEGVASKDRHIMANSFQDVSGQYHIASNVLDHENTHILLASLLDGQHPANLDLIEGFARGVETILNYPDKYAKRWKKVLAEAFDMLRSGQDPGVSNTRLLELRGQGNIYNLSYEMDALAGVLYMLFPQSWPRIMKTMYLKAAEKLRDEHGKTVLKTQGVRIPYVPQRVVNHAVLKSALDTLEVNPQENPANPPLAPLIELTHRYPTWKDGLAYFIEAATLSMRTANKP